MKLAILKKAGLLVKAKSPEILLVAGVGLIIGSTIVICKNSKKGASIVSQASDDIQDVRDTCDKYDQDADADHEAIAKQRRHDIFVVYKRATGELVRAYALPAVMMITGLGCVFGSHAIVKSRNLALTAAYTALDQSYKDYRERVVDKLGEESDRYFRHGIVSEEIEYTETTKSGKEKQHKETVNYIPTEEGVEAKLKSPYARFFDELSDQFVPDDPNYNKAFLLHAQDAFNDRLHSRGFVFLNEVYEELGFKRTDEGQLVGWLDSGNGDGYIDFGIFDYSRANRRFVNGYEPICLLDFNVDGVIYGKLNHIA